MANQNKRIKILILSASALILLLFILAFFIPARAAESNPGENPNQPSGKYAALTFDDGPRRGTTDILLNGLRERGVRATFFLIGEEAEANPDLVLRMKSEGHQIGNHTWSHARLDDLSDEEITREVGRTDELLQSILGPGEYWLRPPYGFIRAGTENLIPVPMIAWSADPRDWESRDTEKIIQSVLDSIEPGSIILLHDIYPTSVDAALKLIDELSGQDYEFVTVQELFSLYDIQPEAGVKYRGAIK